jgi:integrase
MEPPISDLLTHARSFDAHRAKPSTKIPLDPLIADAPSIVEAIAGMMATTGCSRVDAEDAVMRAQNFHELLTHEEIAERLKVPATWVYEKTRKRCQNPIPSIPMGRYIRFDWDAVVRLLHIKGFLSGVFSVAKQLGAYDGENPIRDTAVPKGTAPRTTYAYTLDEIQKMIPAITNDTYRTAVIVAAFTGLALSELRGLRFSDVGEEQINVRTSYWRSREGSTKTKARTAAIPLLPIVRRAIAEHHKRNPKSEFVFEGPNQRPLDLSTIGSKQIKTDLAEHGIEFHAWHAFRRGLATNLHDLGVQDKTIQAILRHSNVAITQAAYIKQLPAASVAAMRKLEAKWKRKR